MHVTRHTDAKPYDAPLHNDVDSVRLHGFDASPSEAFWVGRSTYKPGGTAEMSSTPMEKVYYVLEGELTVITENDEVVLGPNDSVHLANGEARAVENRSDSDVDMLVLMTYPPAS